MQEPMTYQPAAPSWTFTPSWENPRIRRLVAVTVVYQIITLPGFFTLYHFLFHWSVGFALIVTLANGIFSVVSTFTWSRPTRQQLVINPFGLYYRNRNSYSVRATWSDVESVGRYRWMWFPAEEGVFLRKGVPMSNPLMGLYGRWGRFVPLSLFDEHWQTSEIGALLRGYAPWLLKAPSGESASG